MLINYSVWLCWDEKHSNQIHGRRGILQKEGPCSWLAWQWSRACQLRERKKHVSFSILKGDDKKIQVFIFLICTVPVVNIGSINNSQAEKLCDWYTRFFAVWDSDISVVSCVGWCHTLIVSILRDLCECEEAAVRHGSPEHMVMCNDQDILHYRWANCQSAAAHWEQNAGVSPLTSRKKLNWLNILPQNNLLCSPLLQSLFSRLTFNV